uniref:DDHD domain-containing protein n=1 Tax=Steinernema glaseri TaxID=37863 RepID=A0A1I7YIL8_9BILA
MMLSLRFLWEMDAVSASDGLLEGTRASTMCISAPDSTATASSENMEVLPLRTGQVNGETERPSSANATADEDMTNGEKTPMAGPDSELLPPSVTVSVKDPAPTPTAAPVVPPRSRKKKRRVTELSCEEVRWFYRRSGAEPKWTAFKGYDSMMLEINWRRRNNVDIEAKTLEAIESLPKTNNVVVLDGLYKLEEDFTTISAMYWKEDQLEIRRGTWFVADSLQPIVPDVADAIEAHHLQQFRDQLIPEGPVFSEKEASKKPLLTELKLEENEEVRWNSVIDTYLYSNTKTSRLLRYITWGKGTALKRGYAEISSLEDAKPNFAHLILVVHGIGQKGYENLIAKNTEQMRDVINVMMDKHYPGEKQRPMLLPIEWRSSLVLDKGLTDTVTLSRMARMRNTLNSTTMDIMYYLSPLYRKEIVTSVVRALNRAYGLFIEHNPDFSGQVSVYAHSLGSVICYDILTSWSPLLLYDEYVSTTIENHRKDEKNAESAEVFADFQASRQRLLEVKGGIQNVLLSEDEKLDFRVENLFCVGSPLAVFLIMRGVEAEYLIPKGCPVGRILNIFHPYDPVAYRIEPLFHEAYRNIRPVKLHLSADDRARRDYALAPPECQKSYIKKKKNELKTIEKARKSMLKSKDDISAIKSNDEEMYDEEDECDSDDSSNTMAARSACSSPRSITPPPSDEATAANNTAKKGWWVFGGGSSSQKSTKQQPIEIAKEAEAEERKLTHAEQLIETIPPHLRCKYRIDYQLQPALTDKSYWSVLKSHFAYWTNPDLVMYVLNHLYPRKDDNTLKPSKL